MTGPALGPDALAAATARDRGAQLYGGLTEVRCQHCAGQVRVRKNSRAHTSIQWSADATARCVAYTPSGGCRYLGESVNAAVEEGWLEVAAERADAERADAGRGDAGRGDADGLLDELVRPSG